MRGARRELPFFRRLLFSAFHPPPSAFSVPPSSDPNADRQPRPFAQRLGLLLILLLLPCAAVTLPTLVATHFSGQRPAAKNSPAASDTSGLRHELDQRASSLLPTPAPLTLEPIRISVREVSHVGPRAETVKAQAKAFGGTAVEGLATGGETHLFVDLPAGAADAFRLAVMSNLPGQPLASPPPSSTAARDQVEVFIRAAANDE